ncbi:hypothetical protein ACFWCB_18795 [Streptomyces sp. NPDC060048]|uniref:hypothetical protein n=1 Tax=unclassified Streptomyces TaxID=2593676 RepID=UPI0036B9CF26
MPNHDPYAAQLADPEYFRREYAEMRRRLERLDRAIDSAFVLLAVLGGIAGSVVFLVAAQQFFVSQNGPMAGGGAALATLLFGGAAWSGQKAGKRRKTRRSGTSAA